MEDSPKRILILSYFFPPCELTASQRTESWANEFAKNNFQVIVITRKWEKSVKALEDMHFSTSRGTSLNINGNLKIVAVEHHANLRDRLLTSNKRSILRRTLSIIELVLQNLFPKTCGFYNLYVEAYKICKKENIDLIIASGKPYMLFQFAYKLSNKFSIPWIADYRDAWTTGTINLIGKSFLYRVIDKWDSIFEQKWVSRSSYITASSGEIGDSVTKITGVPNMAIHNGYEAHLFTPFESIQKRRDKFVISYIGTLYNGQNIELFLSAFKLFAEKHNNCILQFPGLALNSEQKSRVESFMKGYENYISITERIPQNEILKIEKESHILLHVAWQGHKGIIASKIYEYIGSGSKVLVAPGDSSSVDEIMGNYVNGTVKNSESEILNYLNEEYVLWKENNEDEKPIDHNQEYTRQSQAAKLIELTNTLIENNGL